MLKKKIKAGITNLRGFAPTEVGPEELLGELLQDVQLRRVHPDGKTFVDLVSERKLRRIAKAYRQARLAPDFDLHDFVGRHFHQYLIKHGDVYRAMDGRSVHEHIEALWPVLTRSNYRTRGSLMALPYPYVVPGGRFLEQFYWDAYFIMIGLAETGHTDMVEDMVKNYAYLIRKIGYIPTANRTYFLTRSQPPLFSHMVRLLAEKRGRRMYVQYLPYLLAEYRFWMRGSKELTGGKIASRRVVKMPDGSILNRYYDSKSTPRPESYREDVEIATGAHDRVPSRVYLDIRAAAESGWDFSSRWFRDPNDMSTIHTTDIIPVDLNCLLYDLERTIAHAYKILRQGVLSKRYETKAQRRAEAIRTYCWSEHQGYFFDYDFMAKDRTESWHLGAAFTLFTGVATPEEAARTAETLERDFLKNGGLATTLVATGQQWDAPNGWAPLQWAAYKGLRNYGHNDLARKIKERWIESTLGLYDSHAKLVEKYNVEKPGEHAGGGEYELQDGFGWTNGVFLAMEAERD